VVAVSAGGYNGNGGYDYACAIESGGEVACYGDDTWGQLGNGSTSASSVPGLIPSLESGVTSLSAGSGDRPSVCSVVSGAVKCWGSNGGALGNGTTATTSGTPVPVTGFSGTVTSVSVGGDASSGFACALISGGAVQCWGYNASGQLGNGSTTTSAIPVTVSGLTDAVAVSAGYDGACALTSAGAVMCWGANSVGQLGNGTTTSSSVPVQVTGLTSGVTAISTAANSACAVTSGGAAQCWGSNNTGQLGNGSTTNSLTPVQVETLTSGVSTIAVGFDWACAVSGGGVWCWGGTSHVPVHVSGLTY
jgi:alpha-tubulin suppressor-like RCC1 family protein